MYTGDYPIDNTGSVFSYDYYQFVYVDKRTELKSYRDSKGNHRTSQRTVYSSAYRYGFFVNVDAVKSLQIFSKKLKTQYSQTYQPASLEFRNRFTVKTEHLQVTAKFLTPAMVVAIEDLATCVSHINIEVPENGMLSLSFSDNDVLKTSCDYTLQQPQQLYDALDGKTKLRKLDSLLNFLTLIAQPNEQENAIEGHQA